MPRKLFTPQTALANCKQKKLMKCYIVYGYFIKNIMASDVRIRDKSFI